MKKKTKKKKPEFIKVRLYGIFNPKEKKLIRVSLDNDEIDMDLALTSNKDLVECKCDVYFAL